MIKGIKVGMVLATGMLLDAGAQTATQYAWSFPDGNLISNWSFERDADETCLPTTGSGLGTADCKFKMAGAPSGDFVMKVVPGAISTGQTPSTDFLRLEPNGFYNFSVWVKGGWDPTNTGQTAPVLEFFTESKASAGAPVNLEAYELSQDVQSTAWNLYLAPFQAPANAAFVKVRLLKVLSLQKAANTFHFDNMLIQPSTGKLGVLENRSMEDARGVVEQSVLGTGENDVVTFATYDADRRPSRGYVPLVMKKAVQFANPALIAVGTQALGENLDFDFSTFDAAYQALRVWAAALPFGQIGTVIVHVVVDAGNPTAPMGTPTGQQYKPLVAQGGEQAQFTVKGIIRGSSEYQTLLAAHGPPAQPAPASTFYSFAALEPSVYQAQYPGESNFFSEAKYPSPGDNTFQEASVPGSGYEMANGHTGKSGWALVEGPPSVGASSPEVTGPQALPGTTNGLLYQWARDRQGRYSMSYTTPEGLLIRSGQKLGGDWNQTFFTYDDFNRLNATFTPAGTLSMTNYDGEGRPISISDPDRGETKYMYDDRGRLRFVHPAETGTPVNMIAHKYDALGRVLESGTTAYVWDEAQVQNGQSFPIASLEFGRFYDAFTATEWQSRTGVAWSTIGINLNQLRNGKGKLVAAYYRNPESTAPGFASAPDRRLVASLYSYDSLGRVETLFKWIGASEIASDRLQKITYTYDGQGRLAAKRIFATGLGSLLVNAQFFEYDPEGRIKTVLDKDGRAMVAYSYNGLGRMEEARLYGKFRIQWTYSIRGELKKVEATTIASNPEYIFSEELGYDSKPNPDDDVPAPPVPSYDGGVSAILRKFSNDVTGPVELSRYSYDDLGRLIQSSRVTAGPKVGGTSLLGPDGAINFSNISFGTGSSTATESFAYDEDGAIAFQTSPQTGAHGYSYHAVNGDPTHRLKDVSGNRASGASMAATGGNFRYDARGRMTDDLGSQKVFTYGFYNDRVVKIVVPGRSFHMLYDENLNRVAEIEVNAGNAIIGSKVSVYEYGQRAVKEYVSRTASHPLGAVGLVKNSLFGVSGLVGIENQATGQKKLLLKDHLGNSVKILDEGTGAYSGQEEYAYWAYGILDKRVVVSGDLKPAGTYTGKEFNDAVNLYYFGARYYDPELAVWLTPDPARQYSNAYGFGPGDPVNGIDPNGMVWDIFRPSKYKNFFEDAGGLISRESEQTLRDFDNWAKGTPEKDGDDNLFRGLYRSVFGPCRSEKCGDNDGDGIDDAYDTMFGAKLTLGGGGPRVDITDGNGVPIGGIPISRPGGKGDSPNSVDAPLQPNIRIPPEFDSPEEQIAYYKTMQSAHDFFMLYLSDEVAALAYWNYEGGHNYEAGFLYSNGKIKGPYQGESNTTMGQRFANLIGPGDVVVHIHTYQALKARLGGGGLSGSNRFNTRTGDLGVARRNAIYAYEVSTGQIYYSNPRLVRRYGDDPAEEANMYVGTWDYHSVSRRNVKPLSYVKPY